MRGQAVITDYLACDSERYPLKPRHCEISEINDVEEGATIDLPDNSTIEGKNINIKVPHLNAPPDYDPDYDIEYDYWWVFLAPNGDIYAWETSKKVGYYLPDANDLQNNHLLLRKDD